MGISEGRSPGHYFRLVWIMALAELKSERNRTYLGLLWWVMEPILFFITYYLFFGILLDLRNENYAAYLLIGLTSWQWTSKTILGCSNSIYHAGSLIKKIPLNKLLFVSVVWLKDLLKMTIVTVLLSLFLIYLGSFDPNMHHLYQIPIIFMLQSLMLYALGCFAGLVVPFVPDLRHALPLALNLLMFASAVFYEASLVPEKYGFLLELNPAYQIIRIWRELYIDNTLDMQMVFLLACASVLLLVLGWFFEKWYSPKYVHRTQE